MQIKDLTLESTLDFHQGLLRRKASLFEEWVRNLEGKKKEKKSKNYMKITQKDLGTKLFDEGDKTNEPSQGAPRDSHSENSLSFRLQNGMQPSVPSFSFDFKSWSDPNERKF